MQSNINLSDELSSGDDALIFDGYNEGVATIEKNLRANFKA